MYYIGISAYYHESSVFLTDNEGTNCFLKEESKGDPEEDEEEVNFRSQVNLTDPIEKGSSWDALTDFVTDTVQKAPAVGTSSILHKKLDDEISCPLCLYGFASLVCCAYCFCPFFAIH